MRKLFAVVLVLGAVGTTAAVAANSQKDAQPKVDLDLVNKKIDARLHALLASQLARP